MSQGGWPSSSGGGGAIARFSVRGWFVEVGEGAGEVERDVGKLTTASVWAEKDRREGIDGRSKLHGRFQWRPALQTRFRSSNGRNDWEKWRRSWRVRCVRCLDGE